MKRHHTLGELAAIALVLSALLLAVSSLIFDDAGSIARAARQAFGADSRASSFRDSGIDPRVLELAPPLARAASAKSPAAE